jgi:hypothetical protein
VVRRPTTPVWSFELGVGYGQTTGYGSSVAGLELKGAVRDLPAASLYASYVPTGTYFGVRSGFMRFHGLQLFDAEGRSFAGDADSFMAGFAAGQVLELLGIALFAEVGYSVRHFPSVRWSGGPIPAGAPREITANNWFVGGGLQFAVGRS